MEYARSRILSYVIQRARYANTRVFRIPRKLATLSRSSISDYQFHENVRSFMVKVCSLS